jgi:hypothetical protein
VVGPRRSGDMGSRCRGHAQRPPSCEGGIAGDIRLLRGHRRPARARGRRAQPALAQPDHVEGYHRDERNGLSRCAVATVGERGEVMGSDEDLRTPSPGRRGRRCPRDRHGWEWRSHRCDPEARCRRALRRALSTSWVGGQMSRTLHMFSLAIMPRRPTEGLKMASK